MNRSHFRRLATLTGIGVAVLIAALTLSDWQQGTIRASKSFGSTTVRVVERPATRSAHWWSRLLCQADKTYEVQLTDKQGLISSCATPWVKLPSTRIEITKPYPAADVYSVQFGDEFTLSASMNEGEVQLMKWRLSAVAKARRDDQTTRASHSNEPSPQKKLTPRIGDRPFSVVTTVPESESIGVYSDQALVFRLNRKLPDSLKELRSDFVKHRVLIGGSEVNFQPATGRAIILPGRQVIAFLPTPTFIKGPEKGLRHNYMLDLNSETTGIEGLVPFQMNFGVVDLDDQVGPGVGWQQPGYDFIEVRPTYAPSVKWSSPLDPATVSSENARLIDPKTGEHMPVTVDYDYLEDRLYLHPQKPLLPDTQYEVQLGIGFTNLSGHHLLNPFTWRYRTRSGGPTIRPNKGPFVQDLAPPPYETGVSRRALICVTFSDRMKSETLNSNSIHLRAHRGSTDVTAELSYEPELRRLTLLPVSPLASLTRYELTLDLESILAEESDRKPMQGQSQFVFTTQR